ncbi:aminodeoxychorismate synthase component I [Kaarinaea lacus]
MPNKSLPGNKPIVVPVATNDLDLLQLHSLNPSRYPYLLQSVAQSVNQPSYDILFACPQFSLELQVDDSLKIKADFADCVDMGNLANHDDVLSANDFLQNFENFWQQARQGWSTDSDLPFSGGWFMYLGYELSRQIEPRVQATKPASSDLPVAIATRVPAAIIRVHADNKYYLVVEEKYETLKPLIEKDVEQVVNQPAADSNILEINAKQIESSIIHAVAEEQPQAYIDQVTRIKKYIKDGDVFQVNLSRLWQSTLKENVSADRIYQRLRKSNPAPFFALAEYGDTAIISSSPERLVKVEGDKIDTRPIAGTRPRGGTMHSDQANQEELIAHPKERAEHIMLIDLERNDLGRVCVPGSVKVNELMVLESYSHVHHIVSNVQGKLRQNITPSDVIKAVFPGGTITGCPKVRCMEIISELEQSDRGPYTGSLGYINHSGDMDLNILIRTLVKQKNKLSFRAGAGIVADSIPENELEETRAKAKGLLLAL